MAHAASINNGRAVHEHHLNGIFEYILEDGERVGAITHSLNSLLNAIRSHSLEQIQSIYLHNSSAEVSRSRAKYYKNASILRIEAFKDEIQNRYNQAVIDAPISQEIMRTKRAEAEAQIFDGIERKFPVSLFSRCAYTDPYSRQTLSQPVRCARTATFKEVFIEPHQRFQTTQENVLSPNIQNCEEIVLNWPLSLALDRLGWREYRPNSPNQFWENLTDAIQHIRSSNLTPVILDSTGYLMFIDRWENHGNWQNASPPPETFTSHFDENYQEQYGEQYRKHFYDTPTYRWRLRGVNGFFVLGQEQLQEVKFRKYANDTILDLDFEPFDEAPERGRVVFQWEYDIKISGDNVHSIIVDGLNEDDL
ncbi:MAG: hypothetical protein R3D66_03370 [Alphaproteobacteria bacterium]